jgi:ABC-type nickel/cobalt efflux system permease component RcnA
LGTLLRQLVEDGASLVRGEVHLVKLELTRAARAIAVGSTLLALGSAFVSLGVLAVVAGLVLLAGDQWLPADDYWLAALIGVALFGAVSAWLLRRGLARLRPAGVAPMTIATLEEDAQWVKRQWDR